MNRLGVLRIDREESRGKVQNDALTGVYQGYHMSGVKGGLIQHTSSGDYETHVIQNNYNYPKSTPFKNWPSDLHYTNT